MGRVAIEQGTINQVANAVGKLSSAAGEVRNVVARAGDIADTLEENIATVQSEFDAYVAYDTAQKNLLNAKQELVKVRMELDEKFGINQEIRRYLTGILEASDISIVKNEVITNCTEKMMMDCKGYWLAPCLVAIAAWLGDNQPLAERAITEALKRDDEKTSLLFALVCRRVGRQDASIRWLERYLAMQNPREVERKMVTVLDAYSNGLFGQGAKNLCETKIESWITEMAAEPGFVEAQRDSWEQSITSKMQSHPYAKDFPYASKYAENWGACNNSLNDTSLHQTILEYFKDIFEKKNNVNLGLKDRLDTLLENYVSSYDNEELPLRRKERELELMIEERGNASRASARMAGEEKAMEEILDFTQLLTSAAMHADVIKASNATQRLAIALSKDWIIQAYENTTLKIRQKFQDTFQIKIEDWRGQIADGSEEGMLVDSITRYFEGLRERELEAANQSKLDIILPGICAVLALICLISGSGTWAFLMVLGAAGLGLRWYLNKKSTENRKENIRQKFADAIKRGAEMVKALCAERVDYIHLLDSQDQVSNTTLEYLQEVNAVQYVGHGEGRGVKI